MTRLYPLVAALVLALGFPLAASAQVHAERAAMEAKVVEFNDAFKNADFEAVIGAIPPAIVETISETAGLPAAELKKMLVEQTQSVMETVAIESYSMDLDSATIEETSAGRVYASIPTATIMVADGVRMKNESVTVALKDGEKWYLVRIDNASQLILLQRTYEDFAEIEFPSGSMTILE